MSLTLYKHQEEAVELALPILRQEGFVFMSMEVRTGKTISALSIAKEYGAKNPLFVTKKKAISSIISDNELGAFFFNLKVINYESLHKIEPVHDFIIIDESHSLGAFPKPSKRTKQLKKICNGKPIIYLTGTPSPETYVQLYHQLWVSSFSPWNKYSNFYAWAKDDYVFIEKKYLNGFQINDYSTPNTEKIKADIEKYFISVSQKEAGFDCEIIEKVLYVEMNDEQKRLYSELRRNKFATHPEYDKTAIASNGADLVTKLSQICGGSLIYDEDERGTIFSVDKANFIRNSFKNKKIAILYRFKAEFEILKHFFPNWTNSPEIFNYGDEQKVFLSQISSAREGVNLSTADALIFYNIDFSATSYLQARSRTQTKNRKRPALVYFLFTVGGIEERVYKAVQQKKNFTSSYYKQLA